MIPYGRQSISEEDIKAVIKVLRSDFVTQGSMAPRFEEAIAAYTGVSYGVAVSSGTAALHLACRALDLGPGDLLWTTPVTFVASANCALYCGADIDFVDIDPRTYNISVESLGLKLRQADAAGKLPKIVVPVHLCGLPCDMDAISLLAKRYGFRIIEDACHAIGSAYNEVPTGNCRHSDITVFSFHPVKAITTGEGGMAVANDKELADKMALLRSHGITRNPAAMTQIPDGPWYYQQVDLGYNYRMTDFQAALGLSQLKRLDQFVKRRRLIARRYDEMLTDLPVHTQYRPAGYSSSMHLYVIRLQDRRLQKTHKHVFEALREAGVGVSLHYIPVHTQPYYQKMGFRTGNFPEAEQYYREAISLPIFPALEDKQVDEIVNTLRKILLAAS